MGCRVSCAPALSTVAATSSSGASIASTDESAPTFPRIVPSVR